VLHSGAVAVVVWWMVACWSRHRAALFGRYAATLAATRHVVGGFAATRPGTVTYRPLRGHMPNQVSQSGQESQAGTPAGVMGEFGVWAVCCAAMTATPRRVLLSLPVVVLHRELTWVGGGGDVLCLMTR